MNVKKEKQMTLFKVNYRKKIHKKITADSQTSFAG